MIRVTNTHRFTLRAVAAAAAMCALGMAHADEIATGNPDLAIRFDNTVKYNYGYRTGAQRADLLATVNSDDGDRNFNKGTVANRFDVLTEFDVVYKKSMGLRVSASAWVDGAYSHLDNTSVATSNHYENGAPALGMSRYAKRYHKGPSGEVLDAFLFATVDIADMPLSVKLGRHTLYWGESLISPIHGVNYGQSPIDLIKAYSVPGSDAKELFLPRAAASAQFSPSTELSLAAQYFFQWKPARLPESGSFLGFYDYGMQGAETYNLGPLGVAFKGADRAPPKRGDFGVSARWSPAWLDGTLGMYYRRTSDLLPQANLRLAGLPSALFGQNHPLVAANAQAAAAAVMAAGGTPADAQAAAQQAGLQTAVAVGNATCTAAIPGAMVAGGSNCLFYPGTLGAQSQYQLEYANKIDIVGLSLSKNIAGVSIGAELNRRSNMPLLSTAAVLMPAGTNPGIVDALNAAFAPSLVVTAADLPRPGEVSGARGNTWHGVLNFLNTVAKTAVFDSATVITELVWNRVDKVTSGAAFYKGRAGYSGLDKPTKDFVGVAVNFTSTWFQVLPGVDLSMPLSYSVGLAGQSAVISGGNKNAGTYGAGLSFDIYQKYRIDLKYAGFTGPLATDASGAVSSFGGPTALLKDRDFVSVTLKTTF
jgi:hypothetical protein